MLNKKALAAFAAGATLLSGFAFATPANALMLDLVKTLETENFTAPADNDELDHVLFGGGASSSAGSYDATPAAPVADDETPAAPVADDATPAADDFNFDDFNLDDFNFDDLDLSGVEDAPAAPVADDATPAAADDFNFDNFDFSDVEDAPAADNAAPAPAVKHTAPVGAAKRHGNPAVPMRH